MNMWVTKTWAEKSFCGRTSTSRTFADGMYDPILTGDVPTTVGGLACHVDSIDEKVLFGSHGVSC
jgi:hypothetical protein